MCTVLKSKRKRSNKKNNKRDLCCYRCVLLAFPNAKRKKKLNNKHRYIAKYKKKTKNQIIPGSGMTIDETTTKKKKDS